MDSKLTNFTDVLSDPDEICDSQPMSLSFNENYLLSNTNADQELNKEKYEISVPKECRPAKGTGQYGQFRSIEEIDIKYRSVFSYQYFNLVQSKVIDDALYTDKSIVVSAPTGSGKTVVFEMAIVQLLMEMDDNHYSGNFKIIYMAPVKALCTERLTEWYPKFTKLGLHCIEVTGDTDVDFSQLTPYRIIITTPEKWDMLTRRWRDYRQLVEEIKLFLIDEVHILNDAARGPVLEAVVSRMKTIESSAQSAHRIEQLQKQYRGEGTSKETAPKIRFVAVSATVGNPEDVATWLSSSDTPAVYYTFGDESRPVKLRRIVEGYPCPEGTSIFKFDIILNYKLWPVIQKYHNGKPTLIFCNTRKSVLLTAETLSREITVSFSPEQKAKLTALASSFKNKKLQSLILSGVGCHHAGLLYEERTNIEHAFRNRDLPILITTTTLAMGVNLPAHLVIIKNTQQYVNGAYQEYSISTVLQMVGRAGRPQYDTEATAVIMTRMCDKGRYQALVGGSEPLQSYLHKRLAENLNSEAALGTVGDVAQCVQWLRSTFLFVRAARDPKRYLGLPQVAPQNQISKKIEELCVKAMNGLATSGLITMDEASCIESTEAGRLMSIYYLDLETMKHIMKINGSENLEQLLWIICESHELADMHLRVDERRYLNALNRNNAAATIRYPMKGKISTRQMKVNCMIQAILGCLPISDPSLNQEAMKIMRIADRVCRCLFAYVTQPSILTSKPKYYSAVLNSAILTKCVVAHLWENSQFVSKQLKGIGPTFSTLLASAGKVNFMLLEESHPRDLERIMNKGPPAGNVLRKQISLLPKYQLTTTPIDEKSVKIQLDLLNCSYLLENIDNLTAGTNHKSYIIVGDSENHILYFSCFNDNNLISVYNGTITFEISRIHSFEHKIFAHCISSTFAGIDANLNYIFKDLDPQPKLVSDEVKRPIKKQTVITDTFKERKRKNNSDIDITQSKEKKKRESNLIEKFNHLKESFGKTSKEIKEDLEKSTNLSNKIIEDLHQFNEPIFVDNIYHNNIAIDNKQNHIHAIDEISRPQEIFEDCNDEFMDDDKINDILNEIESEISRGGKQRDNGIDQTTTSKVPSNNYSLFKHPHDKQMHKKFVKNNMPVKSNYNFIDLLEKNIEFNDEDDKDNTKKEANSTGFSNNIKELVEKFLNQIQNDKVLDKQITDLINMDSKKENNEHTKPVQKINSSEEIKIFDDQDLCLKEALNDFDLPPPQSNENYSDGEGNNNQDTTKSGDKILRTEDCSTHNITETVDDDLNDLPNTKVNEWEAKQHTSLCLGDMIETDDFKTKDPIKHKSKDSVESNNPNSPTNISPLTNVNDQKLRKYDINREQKIENQHFVEILNDNNTQNIKNQNSLALRHPSPAREISETELLQEKIPQFSLPFMTESKLHSAEQLNQNNTIQDKIYEHCKGHKQERVNKHFTNTVNDNDKRRTSDKTYHSQAGEYVKKYSYTTGYTNVITNVTYDSVVRITRRLHLNLDVTEVLHKDTICNFNKPISQLNSKVLHSEQLIENCSDYGVPAIEDARENFDNNSIHHNNYCKETNSDFQLDDKQKAPDRSICFNYFVDKPDGESNNGCKNGIKPADSDKSVESLPTHLDNERNEIHSILQKYSKIMSKKHTVEINMNIANQNLKPSSNNVESTKPKRPFKISDIDKLNSKVPSFLIKHSKSTHTDSSFLAQQSMPTHTDSYNNINERAEVKNVDPIMKSLNSSTTKKHKEILNRDQNTIRKFDENLVEETAPEFFPQNDELEDPESIELNIDPTMFNPKTLLQCFSNEENADLLPPPPEFCDTHSPTDNQDVGDISIESYDPIKWSNNLDNSLSLLQNDCDIDLTPTKEIETWTLSQDSEIDSSSLSFRTPQNYLGVNQNTQNDLQYRTTMHRHARLGKFKFTGKRKMKL